MEKSQRQKGYAIGGKRWAIALSLLSSLLITHPTHAAERIDLQYGLLELSITREALETFATTGELQGSLRPILARLGPEAQAQLQAVLQARYEVDPVLVNRFSYTRSGHQLLTQVGEIIQTESGQNGFYALRAALTLAASDPEGLSILNFITHLPTDMRIDLVRTLYLARELRTLLNQTEQTMAQLAAATEAIATTESSVNFTALPDPRQGGNWIPTLQTLELYDSERDRPLVVDVYVPTQFDENEPSDTSQRFPVVVISNGLGARRDRFDGLALHLVSHGFAVAIPDHPGSDRQRLLDFYQGLHSENFEAREYIDRPLDIQFLLDELTRLNGGEFGGQLDPSRTGVLGYSFGGTTALALAGARIERAHLSHACATESGLLNISLLYQCRALELPFPLPDLRDERVQAIYLFVPFSRSLYGPEGLAQVETPVFWEAAEQDILTPLMIEQIPAFGWLTQDPLSQHGNHRYTDRYADRHTDRYLVVSEGLPHAQLTLDVINRLTNQQREWDEVKAIAETYHQMLSLAFFQVYLTDQEQYRPYLSASGLQYLTTAPYPLYVAHPTSRNHQFDHLPFDHLPPDSR